MKTFSGISDEIQKAAWEVVRRNEIVRAWEKIGAKVCVVGSLATGLLAKRRDIDLHAYTSLLDAKNGFSAMAEIAKGGNIKSCSFLDLSSTREECMEWHAVVRGPDDADWSIDIINIKTASPFDGYFEETARIIKKSLTAQLRETILQLKFSEPENENIPGISYCRAVIEDSVKTPEEMLDWHRNHPLAGIDMWRPEIKPAKG